MTKSLRLLAAAGLIVVPFLSTPAMADGHFPSWSGWWFGVQAGASRSSAQTSLSSAEGFCIAEASGIGASSSCTFTTDSVIAESEVRTSEAEAASISGAGNNAGASVASSAAASSAAFPAPASPVSVLISLTGGSLTSDQRSGAGAGSSIVPPIAPAVYGGSTDSAALASVANAAYAAYSRSSATGVAGSGTSSAFASRGLFDFSGLGSASGSTGLLGLHVHHDREWHEDYLLGAGIDFSTTPGSHEVGASSDATNVTLNFGSSSETLLASAEQSFDIKTNGLFSARARFGRDHGSWMSYATGGLAIGEFEASLQKSGSFQRSSSSEELFSSVETQTERALGAVVGGGVSFWLNDRTAVSLEALYYFFNSTIRFDAGETVDVDNFATFSTKIELEAELDPFRFRWTRFCL